MFEGVIIHDKRIVLSSNMEIHTWCSCHRDFNISACGNILLLERMAVHGNIIYSNVFCWNCNDVRGLMFVFGFVIAGLNFRFEWIMLPNRVSWIAAAVFLLSYLLYAEVLRENIYLLRTVEVQQGQKVIDTGLYGIVRHPMYSVTIILFLSMPLVLGSILSFAIFLVYPIIVAKRIRNEEIVLEKGLEGYAKYKKKVKYRIVPFVW